ncbi:MAG: hypothetical protein II242_03665 [Peptococcaceae bacterium]|nr:hypothetical protein [Peptococcaceae bacterium]MBQ2014259.1 hypothetical protein [Peptococcaceae bacterium]
MNAQQAIRAAAAFRAGLMFIRGLKRTMAQDAQIKGGWITIGAKKADAEGKGGRKGIHVKVDDNGRVVAGLGGKRSKGKSLKAAIRGLNAEREREKNSKLNAEVPQKPQIKSENEPQISKEQTDKQTESKQISEEQTPEQKAAKRAENESKSILRYGFDLHRDFNNWRGVWPESEKDTMQKTQSRFADYMDMLRDVKNRAVGGMKTENQRQFARESLTKIDDIMHGIKKDVQLNGRAHPLDLVLLAQRLKMYTEKLREIAD